MILSKQTNKQMYPCGGGVSLLLESNPILVNIEAPQCSPVLCRGNNVLSCVSVMGILETELIFHLGKTL